MVISCGLLDDVGRRVEVLVEAMAGAARGENSHLPLTPPLSQHHPPTRSLVAPKLPEPRSPCPGGHLARPGGSAGGGFVGAIERCGITSLASRALVDAPPARGLVAGGRDLALPSVYLGSPVL